MSCESSTVYFHRQTASELNEKCAFSGALVRLLPEGRPLLIARRRAEQASTQASTNCSSLEWPLHSGLLKLKRNETILALKEEYTYLQYISWSLLAQSTSYIKTSRKIYLCVRYSQTLFYFYFLLSINFRLTLIFFITLQ